MAGVSRQQYTSEIRLIRVMCSGRVDLAFILRSFAKRQDGVFIGGCRLNECNYTTQGNYDALANVYLCRKIMERIGLNPERLRIAFMSSGDGSLLAEGIDDFVATVKGIGPLGEAEGIDERELSLRLEAVQKLVPYIKLVERQRLRAPGKSAEAYHDFFTGDAFNDLFDTLIADKITASRLVRLLAEKPLSSGEIAARLGLTPSEVSEQMRRSTRDGFVRYDIDRKRYTTCSDSY